MRTSVIAKSALTAALAALSVAAVPALAWEPTKTVEFIVPRGPARGRPDGALHRRVVKKHQLMKAPLVVINKSGAPVLKAFSTSRSQGRPVQDHHHASNLFTTPLATGVPFNWKDLTPCR